MKLKFLGVGGAFAPISQGNSNMMLTSETGKIMLIDFGLTAPFIFRDELGLNFQDIDMVYISHLHADHIGGLELLAFSRFFIPKKDKDGNIVKPKLIMMASLMKELWEHSLKGGLDCIEGRMMNLTDYFECIPLQDNEHFMWEGYKFNTVQTIHVMSAYVFKHSYGLMIESPSKFKTFITTDTQFCPYQMRAFYKLADLIFHDGETSPAAFKSRVHSHVDDLDTVELEYKCKMWLYHNGKIIENIKERGFLGFVTKFQEFEI